ITDRVSASYKTVRMIQDIIVVITAWILGGPVGVSTFITGFLAGPLIDFFSNRFTRKLTDKIEAQA
ncbi:MAG: YczE/YyaS/YitT family protein, partial [Ruoffia tabacinasalis]